MLHKFSRQFLEKWRRMARHELAVFLSPAAMADGQCLHRAGDRHVKEPPLFVERAFGFRALVRQQAILHADDIDVRKLEALATVHGDERHGIAARFVLFLAFGIEHDVFKKILQSLKQRVR